MTISKRSWLVLWGVVVASSVWVYLAISSNSGGEKPVVDSKRGSPAPEQVGFSSPEEMIRKGLEHKVVLEGFVRDQEGNPVAGAEVTVSLPLAGADESPLSLKTDSMGGFKIGGVNSPSVFLQAVPPAGYVATEDSGKKIDFFVGSKVRQAKGSKMDFSMEGEFQNPKDPVVLFVKAIKGADPVFIRKISGLLPKDGQGRYFVVDGAKVSPLSENVAGGVHQLLVQCWIDQANRIPTTQPGADYSHVYSWRFRISVPGGGVARVLTSGEDDVMAPETGYAEFVEISMDRDVKEENWSSGQKMRVYFKFADSTYGRADLSMQTGGSHYVRIASVYNPSGGRNTLVDKSKLLGEEE